MMVTWPNKGDNDGDVVRRGEREAMRESASRELERVSMRGRERLIGKPGMANLSSGTSISDQIK